MRRLLPALVLTVLLAGPAPAATVTRAGTAPGQVSGVAVLPDGSTRLGLTGVAARRNGLATALPGAALGPVTRLAGRAGFGDDAVIPTLDGGAVVLRIDDAGVRLGTVDAGGRSTSDVTRPVRVDAAFPGLAVAADGSAVALWLDGSQRRTRVRYATRPPGGAFGPARTLPGRFGDIQGVEAVVRAGLGRSGIISARDELGATSVALVRGGRPTQTVRFGRDVAQATAVGSDGTAALATQRGARLVLRFAGPGAASFGAQVPVPAGKRRLVGAGSLALAPDGSPLLLLADPNEFAVSELRTGPRAQTSRKLPIGALEEDTEVVASPDGGAVLVSISDYSKPEPSGPESTGTEVALVRPDGGLATVLLPPAAGESFLTEQSVAFGPAGELVVAQTTYGRRTSRTALLRVAP